MRLAFPSWPQQTIEQSDIFSEDTKWIFQLFSCHQKIMKREAAIKQQQELWQAYYMQLSAYYVSQTRKTYKRCAQSIVLKIDGLSPWNDERKPLVLLWVYSHHRLFFVGWLTIDSEWMQLCEWCELIEMPLYFAGDKSGSDHLDFGRPRQRQRHSMCENCGKI